jgi:hypothetical protein
MSYDEDAFMRLDSASEESDQNERNDEPILEDESTCSTADGGGGDDDADNIIMEYLLNGYALTSLMCPSCHTPLIKNFNEDPEESSPTVDQEKHDVGKPINGIPFCVSCKAVVVTSNSELQIMWKNEYKYLMGVEGAVHLAINGTGGDPSNIRDAARHNLFQNSATSQDDQDDNEAAEEGIDRENSEENTANLHVVVSGEEEVQESTVDNVKNAPHDGTNGEAVSNVETQSKEEIDIGVLDYKKR